MKDFIDQHPPLPKHSLERYKDAIPRGIADQGKLVKNTGAQQAYGSFYQGSINVKKTSSKNPKLETVREIEKQTQLRIDLAHETSGMFTVLIMLSDWNEC